MKFVLTNGVHRLSKTTVVGGKAQTIGVNAERGDIIEDDKDLAALYPEKFTRVPEGTVVTKETPADVASAEAMAKLNDSKKKAFLDEVDEVEAGPEVELSKMSIDELKAMAEELGIDIKGVTRKAEIIAAIQVATEDA
jgi:hypothetical protein